MLMGEFEELLFAQPFNPFMVVTADGRRLYVKQPDYAWHPPKALRLVWIAKDDPSSAAVVDSQHFTQLVIGERPVVRPRKRCRA